jgi:hypothetical protein
MKSKFKAWKRSSLKRYQPNKYQHFGGGKNPFQIYSPLSTINDKCISREPKKTD